MLQVMLSYRTRAVARWCSTLYPTFQIFNDPGKQLFKNIVGKGENPGNKHFLLFPQHFIGYIYFSNANGFNLNNS